MAMTVDQIKAALIYWDRGSVAEKVDYVINKYKNVTPGSLREMNENNNVPWIEYAAFMYHWQNIQNRTTILAAEFDLTPVFKALVEESSPDKAVMLEEDWFCPKCFHKLNHFSGLNAMPAHFYCPICLDVAYSEDSGLKLFDYV